MNLPDNLPSRKSQILPMVTGLVVVGMTIGGVFAKASDMKDSRLRQDGIPACTEGVNGWRDLCVRPVFIKK